MDDAPRPRSRPADVQRVHASDQLTAVARDMARPVAAFYRTLVEDGVPREDARALAGDLLRQLLADIRGLSGR